MCMIDGGEQCDVYSAFNRRARKERRCDECSRTIGVGETYRASKGLYDGYWSAYVMCGHCEVAASWLAANCGGFMHHGVWEDFEEHITEYPQLARPLERLRVGRKRRWLRFDGSGLMAVPPVPPTLESVGLGH